MDLYIVMTYAGDPAEMQLKHFREYQNAYDYFFENVKYSGGDIKDVIFDDDQITKNWQSKGLTKSWVKLVSVKTID